ncbi:hypothetical protein FHX74_000893 [Friedmanniella endophytica]|uniref:Uncharacterized protein n=1 Tax=Microlunatus kandeliicorticis TaxID=1759536 RepID=A0A7W3IQE5_9ACTN|nr:hypothetical protein [Microlunatus kandeliicorticis]MBA8793299.1 hypothetical protein [Microlunatus kandeliicorticis]
MAARQVGPYRLRRALSKGAGGSVHRAVGPTGTTVLVVLAPASPAEAVSAFVSRVNAAAIGTIENSSLYEDRPWAAVPASRPDVAWGLLGQAAPAAAGAPAVSSYVGSGPAGADRPESRAEMLRRVYPRTADSYPPPSAARPTRLLVAAVTTAVLITVVIVTVVLHRPAETSGPLPLPSPTTTRNPTPRGPVPTRDPSSGPRPDVPMLSHRWGVTDDVYRMALGGVPFAFRAPGSWGCMARGDAVHVYWECVNEQSKDPVPSVMRLFVEPCSPCTGSREKALVDALGSRRQARADLWESTKQVETGTRVFEEHLSGQAAKDTWPHDYALIRQLDENADGKPDAVLIAFAYANDDDRLGTEKMFGDLYDGSR